MRRTLTGLIFLLMGLTSSLSAQETTALRELIEAAESHYGVDGALIEAIIAQESGRWPWALNLDGVSLKPRTRDEAERILSQSGDNTDIGLMQVNYRQWGRVAGLSKRELLDPWINIAVGTQILRLKMSEEEGWPGVARYHSATPWRNILYASTVSRIYSVLHETRRKSPSPPPLPLGDAPLSFILSPTGGEGQGEGKRQGEELHPPQVAVQGIVIVSDIGIRVVLLSEPTLTGGATREFSQGESLGEWTIAEILADRVVMRRGELSMEIRTR